MKPTSRIVNVTPPIVVQAVDFPAAAPSPSRIITPPSAAVVTGAGAFALLQPVAYMVETQPPEPGHHVQAVHADAVAVGTDYVLVLVVIMIGATRAVAKLMRLPLDHLR